MRPRHVRPVIAAIVAAALAACASGGTPESGTAAPGPVDAAVFAPALDVDLAAMERTRSGLRVRDLRVGGGPVAVHGALARVRYAGWLADGTPIDSSGTGGAPVGFRIGEREVIRGWDEGVRGMRVGGRRQLVVPPRLGYGGRRVGPVPPGAVLVFVIDLVEVR